ncbi:MAG: YicC family protein [Bacteroidales bacterium]|nr:YicC family protein [Bacteroidales bacterium]
MIRSMTGYGKAELTLSDKTIQVEIKSLNSKNCDINLKTPYAYRSKELEVRQLVTEKLQRGKIDLSLSYELKSGVTPSTLNKDVILSYHKQFRELATELGISTETDFLSLVMRLPDTIKQDKNEFEESEWTEIRKLILIALEQVDIFRVQEGKALEKDLFSNLDSILRGLEKIGPFENARIQKIREKIYSQLEELKIKEDLDKNRFEQELIYYLERLDVSEEKVRLANHCKYFRDTINNEDNAGKKLGFIVQEMGREINTLGSKASDSEMQKIVVNMKDDLERIKEQILNIL